MQQVLTHNSYLTQYFLIYLPSSLGNVYIADYKNNRIRKVTASTATSTPRYQSIQILSFFHLFTTYLPFY